MNYKFLYDVDYNYLKTYLRNLNNSELRIVLEDSIIKEKLINPENKYEFVWFAQSESSKAVKNLYEYYKNKGEEDKFFEELY